MHLLGIILTTICFLGTGLSTTLKIVPPTGITVVNAAAPPNNFYAELKNIIRNVPHKQIEHLVRAYALNDAEFQAVIREINSLPSYRLRLQLLNQPEVRQLLQWMSQQLILSGGSFEVFEDLEFEIKILNKYPHWAQTVNGIAGFEQELDFIYPLASIRKLLETTAQQSPVFGEFWKRIVALKPVYERFIATPQCTAFANRLRALGVDVEGVDLFLRYQLGWTNETLPNDFETTDYDYKYNYGFY